MYVQVCHRQTLSAMNLVINAERDEVINLTEGKLMADAQSTKNSELKVGEGEIYAVRDKH